MENPIYLKLRCSKPSCQWLFAVASSSIWLARETDQFLRAIQSHRPSTSPISTCHDVQMLNRSQAWTEADQPNPAFDLIDFPPKLFNLLVELLQAFLHCWESWQELDSIDQLILLLPTQFFKGVTLHLRYHGLQHFHLGVKWKCGVILLQNTDACNQPERQAPKFSTWDPAAVLSSGFTEDSKQKITWFHLTTWFWATLCHFHAHPIRKIPNPTDQGHLVGGATTILKKWFCIY